MITATEANKLAKENEPSITLQEIEDSILKQCMEGKTYTWIDKKINSLTIENLQDAGYTITTDGTAIRIGW